MLGGTTSHYCASAAVTTTEPVGALLMLIVGPLATAIIQMAISRQPKFEADRVGAEIAGTPLGLASAGGGCRRSSRPNRQPTSASPASRPLPPVGDLRA